MKRTIIVTHSKNLSFSKKIVKNLPLAIRKQLPKEIAIIAVLPQESLRLNRQYRNKQKPANVLSFLYSPEYGELIICPTIIYREAKEQSNSQLFQMTWMIVHGMLHLAGMHHEASHAVAKKVERVEQTILSSMFRRKIKNEKIKN